MPPATKTASNTGVNRESRSRRKRNEAIRSPSFLAQVRGGLGDHAARSGERSLPDCEPEGPYRGHEQDVQAA
jgi:hypothetical protein